MSHRHWSEKACWNQCKLEMQKRIIATDLWNSSSKKLLKIWDNVLFIEVEVLEHFQDTSFPGWFRAIASEDPKISCKKVAWITSEKELNSWSRCLLFNVRIWWLFKAWFLFKNYSHPKEVELLIILRIDRALNNVLDQRICNGVVFSWVLEQLVS